MVEVWAGQCEGDFLSRLGEIDMGEGDQPSQHGEREGLEGWLMMGVWLQV